MHQLTVGGVLVDQGRKKIDIHFLSGLLNFSFHLPPMKCYSGVAASMAIEGQMQTKYVWRFSTQLSINLVVLSFEIASDWKYLFIKLTFSFRLSRPVGAVVEHWTSVWEVLGSNPGQTKTQGL